jgi:hypothetical protein
MASATCRHERQQRLMGRSFPVSQHLALAAWIGVAAAAASGSALAQSATNACTRAYGDWVAQRDVQLQRLEPTPTLLGLDNTWCTSSLARVAELRAKLGSVHETCAAVSGNEKARVDSLIIRSGLLLDRVKFCAAQVVVADAEEPWKTSVRIPPAQKAAIEKPAAKKTVAEGKPAPQVSRAAEAPQQRERVEKQTEDRTRTAWAPIKGKAQAAAPSKEAAQPIITAAATPSKPGAAADEFDYLKRYAVQAGSADQPAEDEDCLVVTRTSPASYLIENKNCRPLIILTAIELNRPGQGMRCFTKKIADGIAIAGEGETAPQINFQCKEGSQGCAEGMLRGMFPECQPG